MPCCVFPASHKSASGFTLVELSIVLVILGLLVGGVLAGQSLIQAAELRAITREHSQYQVAFTTFRDKYFALPGDMINATDYWGTATNCPGVNGQGSTKLTCNGDASGFIDFQSSNSAEIFRAWQHLGNAGLVEGQYDGVQTASSPFSIGRENTPTSKYKGAFWSLVSAKESIGWYMNIFRPARYTHWVELGTKGTNNEGLSHVPLLTTADAYNLDMKMDDGKPGTGVVTSFNNTMLADCASTDSAATAIYQLGNPGATCVLFFGL